MSFWKSLFGGLFGSRHKEQSVEDWAAQKSTIPRYVGQQIMPGRLEEGQMREAPPEVMAKFSAEELEADESIGGTTTAIPMVSMPPGYQEYLAMKPAPAVRRANEPSRKPSTRKNGKTRQPIAARKALKAVKAKKRAHKRK